MAALPRPIRTLLKSPVSRISFGLVMLTVSLILMSDFLGLVPNANRAELEIRKTLAESLAVQISLNAGEQDPAKLSALFESVQRRNERVESLGAATADGVTIAATAEHTVLWGANSRHQSTPTHTWVSIYDRDGKWGDLQIVFADLSKSAGKFGSGALSWLIVYITVFGFIGYFLFLKRILKELDPNQVLPDRVRSALDTLSEGLMILDAQGSIMFSNKALADRLGVKPQKLIGSHSGKLRWLDGSVDYSEGMVPLQPEKLPWTRSLGGEEVEQGSLLTLESGPGQIYKFAVNTSLIQSGNNQTRGVLVTLSDMSEVEKQRNDLRRAMTRLEKTQAEITNKNEELYKLATRDPLTDVLNRRAFLEAFEKMFADSMLTKENLGCIMVDIDKFKSVNDVHGHGVGDLVIQYLASVLVMHTGENDLVARFGGEEFCVIMPATSLQASTVVAENIREHLEKCDDATFRDKLTITSSFGVSAMPSEAQSTQQLLDFADKALYHSKETGRNRVSMYQNGSFKTWMTKTVSGDQAESGTAQSVPDASGASLSDHQVVPESQQPREQSAAAQADMSQAGAANIPEQYQTAHEGEGSAQQAHPDQSVQLGLQQQPLLERRALAGGSSGEQGAQVLYESAFSITLRHQLLFSIEQSIRVAKTNKTITAIIVLDTRAIQQISNTLGYSTGLGVGSALIDRLKNLLRSGDVISQALQSSPDNAESPSGTSTEEDGNIGNTASVSRTEGDEIVMLINEIESVETVDPIIDRIRHSFASPFSVDGHELNLESCIGISIYSVDADSAARMLQNASIACANAIKAGRRNGFAYYSKDADEKARRRFKLQSDLHYAAERNELRLAYQPKFSLKTGALVGFEALLRWNHPTLGQISAHEFIKLAEELDMISAISRWSISTAMAQVAAWRKKGYSQFAVALNLSAREFVDPDLDKHLIAELESHQLTPDTIEFEITETAGIDSSETAAKTIKALSEYGFTIAIDDFGTGFASLNYLQLFPVNRIKIDRSFISQVDQDKRKAQLVRAIISMGSSMGISILAEGVETEGELSFLHEYGCHQIQGYLVGKPLEADTVFKLGVEGRWINQRILRSRMRLESFGRDDAGKTSDGDAMTTQSAMPVTGIASVVNVYPDGGNELAAYTDLSSSWVEATPSETSRSDQSRDPQSGEGSH